MGTGSIKECSFENCSALNMAGAIWITESGSLDDSAFVNNSVTFAGGAIYIDDGVNLYRISNSTFNYNAILNENLGNYRYGGALYCYSNLSIDWADFEGNSADYGGAVYTESWLSLGSPSYVTFTSNHANVHGGAVYCNDISTDDEIFTGNSAGSYGGAIYIKTGGSPYFTASTFTGNSANEGGAIYTNSYITINSGVSFESNSATTGGAIYLGGAYAEDCQISHVEFIENTV
jgi:predicted outer membrane repeat protein